MIKKIIDKLKPKKRASTPWKFEYYRSPKNHKWYFRLKASNGEIVASSRQGYNNGVDCLHTMERIQEGAATSIIMDVTKQEKDAREAKSDS